MCIHAYMYMYMYVHILMYSVCVLEYQPPELRTCISVAQSLIDIECADVMGSNSSSFLCPGVQCHAYLQLEAEKTKAHVPGMVSETEHDDTEETAVSHTIAWLHVCMCFRKNVTVYISHVHVCALSCVLCVQCTCTCTYT